MSKEEKGEDTDSARIESRNEGEGQVLSNAAIRDELCYRLSSVADCEIKGNQIVINRKYYVRAEYVLYRLHIHDTPPVFIINTSDLPQQLCNELDQLKNRDLKKFDKTITEAIDSLMEGINNRYYNVNGAAYKVNWRFDP
jgi:hypothetical protein